MEESVVIFLRVKFLGRAEAEIVRDFALPTLQYYRGHMSMCPEKKKNL